MAVQVAQVQKKDDPLTGMVTSIGSDVLRSKIGGMGGGAGKAAAPKEPDPKPDAPKPGPETPKQPAAAGDAGMGGMFDGLNKRPNQPPLSNPRDRRMAGGY